MPASDRSASVSALPQRPRNPRRGRGTGASAATTGARLPTSPTIPTGSGAAESAPRLFSAEGEAGAAATLGPRLERRREGGGAGVCEASRTPLPERVTRVLTAASADADRGSEGAGVVGAATAACDGWAAVTGGCCKVEQIKHECAAASD